jgi:hypothetical protein
MAFLGAVCLGTNALIGYCTAHNVEVPSPLATQFFGVSTAFIFAQGINILSKRGTLRGSEQVALALVAAPIANMGLSVMGQAAGKIAAFALIIPPRVVLPKPADPASRLA